MQKKQTVLIFGVSSFLGSNLAEAFKDEYKVVGTYHNTRISSRDFLTIKCDIKKANLVKGIVNLTKPDIVFYCVGVTDLDFCQSNQKESDILNTNGLFSVVNAIDTYNSKLFYFSSAMVYSGSDRKFSEMDTPIPNTAYGNSLASSEFFIQKSYLNYTIIRVPKIYGPGASPINENYFEKIQKAIITGANYEAENHSYHGHLNVKDFINVVKQCIRNKITNATMNFSSSDSMTSFEFAKLYTEVFGEKDEFLAKSTKKLPELSSISNQRLRDNKFVFEMNCENACELLEIKQKTIRESLIDYKNSFEKKKKVNLKAI